MRDGWRAAKLGELCRVELGKTPARADKSLWDERRQTDNVWLSIADLLNAEDGIVTDSREYLSDQGAAVSKTVREGTLLVSFKLTLGRMAFAGRDLFTNEAIAALTVLDERELSKRFLLHFLHFFDWDAATEGDIKLKGKTLNKEKLREIEVQFPSLAQQQRIVAILDEAFEDITATRATAEKNVEKALDLFEAELESVFAELWRGSTVTTLSDLAVCITDGDHMPPPKCDSGVPFITISNIEKRSRAIDFSDTFMVPRHYFDALKPERRPASGDVLYTVTGSFGIPVLVPEGIEFCFQRHIGLVRPKPDVDPSWLSYLLLSPQVRRQADAGATGTAQRTVSLKVLRGFSVPIVTGERQRVAASKLAAIEAETRRLASIYQRKIAALDELKRSLLHEAFAGNL